MPDITMCHGGSCGLRETCMRFKAKPSERQSWFADLPGYLDPDGGWECDQWLEFPTQPIDADDWWF